MSRLIIPLMFTVRVTGLSGNIEMGTDKWYIALDYQVIRKSSGSVVNSKTISLLYPAVKFSLTDSEYFKFGNFREGFIFAKLRSFTLSFTDISTQCPCCKIFTSQICLLTVFAKIKFSRKFPNLLRLFIGPRGEKM